MMSDRLWFYLMLIGLAALPIVKIYMIGVEKGLWE